MKVPNITITRNNTTIYLGTIDDQFEGVPEIGTTATVDGEHTMLSLPKKSPWWTRSPTKTLKVGETYKISGVLMDKVDRRAACWSTSSRLHSRVGVHSLPAREGRWSWPTPSTAPPWQGKSVVVFEDLYQGENVVASHADINDEGQTVTFRPA